MTNAFSFDAETIATTDPAAIAWLERTCPGNKKLETHIAASSLNPLVADLLCICVATDDEGYQFDLMRNDPATELRRFVEMTNDIADDQTVFTGFNIKLFDLPLILMHLQRHQITPPEHWPVWAGKYWTGYIHDSMEKMPGTGKAPRMGECCEIYGFKGKAFTVGDKPITGADVVWMHKEKMYQDILDYCSNDAVDELNLYRCQTFGGIWGVREDRNAELKQALSDIDQSELSSSVKWNTARLVLQSSRLL